MVKLLKKDCTLQEYGLYKDMVGMYSGNMNQDFKDFLIEKEYQTRLMYCRTLDVNYIYYCGLFKSLIDKFNNALNSQTT